MLWKSQHPHLQAFAFGLSDPLSQKKPCDITGGIGKHGQLGASRHFGRRKDRFASKTLCPIQRCLQVFDPRIYGNAFAPVIGGAHATVDASGPSSGLDDAILHWVVAVNLPSEELTVKRLEFAPFAAHDFEMNNRCSHSSPFCASSDASRRATPKASPQGRTIASGDEFVLYNNDNCFCPRMILAGVSPMKRLSDRVRCA